MEHPRNHLFCLLARDLGVLDELSLTEGKAGSGEIGEHLVGEGVISSSQRELVDCCVEAVLDLCHGDCALAIQRLSTSPAQPESNGHPGEEAVPEESSVTVTAVEHGVPGAAPPVLRVVKESPGRYRGGEEQERGGIGRVVKVRDEVIGRWVALKELLHDITDGDTDSDATAMARARFLREAQVTGQLEHPSIVPVHELGVRADGRLYYTMKLVRGSTLAHALAAAGSLEERLRLLPHFVDVCQAIGYAHAKGVIHRDIKPANIMVGEFGETVVIDWGLAKIRDETPVELVAASSTVHSASQRRCTLQNNEDATTKTTYGQTVGTPLYMSPEQASGEIDQVREPSDIYSLGAVLYELLAGSPPFHGATSDTVLLKVGTTSPQPVSEIEPAAPVELVAICERAMHRDPTQRYRHAQELADEVQGFVSGGLVRAYRYRFSDHLRRFISRHRASVGIGLIAVAVLIAVLVSATAWNLRERQRAQREARAADEVSQFLLSIFDTSSPDSGQGGEVTAREILENAAAKVRRELADEPLTQARMMVVIGKVCHKLGLYQLAQPLFEQALQTHQRQLGSTHPTTLTDACRLAGLLHDLGQYDAADSLLQECMDSYEVLRQANAVGAATCARILALNYQRQGRFSEAESQYRRAVEELERPGGQENVELAITLRALASLYVEQGKFSEAEGLLTRAVSIFETSEAAMQQDVGAALSHLATVYSYQGKYAEAEPLFRRCVGISQELLGKDHPLVAAGINNLAVCLWYQERYEEIEPLYRRSLEIWYESVGPRHPDYGRGLANLAELYWKLGRFDEAEPLYRQALSIYQLSLGNEHPEVAQALSGLATLYRDQGRFDKAEPLYLRSLAIRERLLEPDHPLLEETRAQYEELLRRMGRSAP